MTRILLSPEFLGAVRKGEKTTTIRRGHRQYVRGPARIVSGCQEVPIQILEVRHKKLKQLDVQDAHADGFGTLEALLSALSAFYPDIKEDEAVTVVRFELV